MQAYQALLMISLLMGIAVSVFGENVQNIVMIVLIVIFYLVLILISVQFRQVPPYMM